MTPATQTPKTVAPGGLTPLELQALRILGKEADKHREFLEAGADQPVDVLVRIDGLVTVGEPQTATVSERPEWLATMARVLDTVGPKTAEKIEAALETGDPPSTASQARAVALQERLSVPKERQRSGNVTGKLHVTRLPSSRKSG